MSWLLRGNVSTRWALVATVLTWLAIPALWVVNELGTLSLVEVFWLLLVVAAWMLALTGLLAGREPGLAAAVFAVSTAVPVVLMSFLLLLIVFSTSGGGPVD